MVRGLFMACLISVGVPCSSPAGNAPQSSSPQEAVDAQVLGACLDAVADELARNAAGSMISPPRNTILILPNSRRADGFLADNQLESELSVSEWESAALLATAMRSRSASAGPILVPSSLQPTRLLETSELSVEPKTPWVEFYRPGYSTDGRSALVRAHFGPTPHGATFTCLLTLELMRWTVRWSKVSYFA